jgi:hypothetical protein
MVGNREELTMRWFVIVAALLLARASVQAQEAIPCSQVGALVKMAQSRTLVALNRARLEASLDYRAQLVFASMQFKIAPNRQSAMALLKVIPRDEESMIPWSLEDSLCEEEAVAEMKTLAGIANVLSRQFARAVILVPEFMPQYLHYVMNSVGIAESDGSVQMRRVCLLRKARLRKEMDALSKKEKRWFEKRVMDMERCKPLSLGEVEQTHQGPAARRGLVCDAYDARRLLTLNLRNFRNLALTPLRRRSARRRRTCPFGRDRQT